MKPINDKAPINFQNYPQMKKIKLAKITRKNFKIYNDSGKC